MIVFCKSLTVFLDSARTFCNSLISLSLPPNVSTSSCNFVKVSLVSFFSRSKSAISLDFFSNAIVSSDNSFFNEVICSYNCSSEFFFSSIKLSISSCFFCNSSSFSSIKELRSFSFLVISSTFFVFVSKSTCKFCIASSFSASSLLIVSKSDITAFCSSIFDCNTPTSELDDSKAAHRSVISCKDAVTSSNLSLVSRKSDTSLCKVSNSFCILSFSSTAFCLLKSRSAQSSFNCLISALRSLRSLRTWSAFSNLSDASKLCDSCCCNSASFSAIVCSKSLIFSIKGAISEAFCESSN